MAKLRAEAEREAAVTAAQNNAPPHPLFEAGLNEKLPEIAFLKVTRIEPPSANGIGGHVDFPRIFPADELQGPEDVIALLGGGRYEITGYTRDPNTGAKGRIVKTARFNWPGAPIPFFSANGQQATGTTAAGSPVSIERPDNTVLIIQVMQQQAAAQQAASDRQMTMMMAMMEQSRQAAAQQAAMQIESMRAFASMMAGQRQDPTAMLTAAAAMASSQVQAITAIMPKPDTRDPMEQLGKVVEVAEKLNLGSGGGKKNGESIGDLLGGLGQAMQGFGAVEAMRIEAAKQGLSGSTPTPEQMAEAMGVAPQSAPPPPPQSAPPPPSPAAPAAYHNGHANEARELED